MCNFILKFSIITTSFFEKADLEQWLKPHILYTDYADILNAIWDVLVEKDLSFVVKDTRTNRVVGVSLNFDARDEPEVPVESKLIIVFEFLEFLEGPIRYFVTFIFKKLQIKANPLIIIEMDNCHKVSIKFFIHL